MSQQRKEQEEAAAELEAYLNKTRPRNLAEGVTSGLGNCIQGAVGVVGAVVLAPVIGMTSGYQKGGIIGSIIGLVGGTVVGAITGVLSAVTGVLKGAGQIVRGVASVPQSITGPKSGKWWNDIDGKKISDHTLNSL